VCRVESGDLLVVASDGLLDCIGRGGHFERARLLAKTLVEASGRGSLRRTARELVRVGEDDLSNDNITAVLVRFEREETRHRAGAPATTKEMNAMAEEVLLIPELYQDNLTRDRTNVPVHARLVLQTSGRLRGQSPGDRLLHPARARLERLHGRALRPGLCTHEAAGSDPGGGGHPP